jgi:hypothetical protein
MTVDGRPDLPERRVPDGPPQIDSAHLTDEAWMNLPHPNGHRIHLRTMFSASMAPFPSPAEAAFDARRPSNQ